MPETTRPPGSGLDTAEPEKRYPPPPLGARFYPFWTLNRSQTVPGLAKRGACVWNFGNVSGSTFRNFGKTAEYGKPNLARFGGTLTSPVRANPQFGKGCKSINPFS